MSTARLINALANRPGHLARALTAGLLGLSLAVLAQSVSQKDVDAAVAATKQAEASLKDATTALAKAQKTQAKAQSAVKDLQDDLAKLRDKLAKAADKDKAKLTASVQKTTEQLAAASAESNKAQASVAAEQTRVTALQAQTDQARANVDNLRTQLKTAEAAAKAQAEQAKRNEALAKQQADAAKAAAEQQKKDAAAAAKAQAEQAQRNEALAKQQADAAASRKALEDKLLAETKAAERDLARDEKRLAKAQADADAARVALDKAQAEAEQAKAVVRQRSSDLINAADANARKAAAAALKRAEASATDKAAAAAAAQTKLVDAQKDLAEQRKTVSDSNARVASLKANAAQTIEARQRAADAEAAAKAAAEQQKKDAAAAAKAQAEQAKRAEALAKQQAEAAAAAAEQQKKDAAAAAKAQAQAAKRAEAPAPAPAALAAAPAAPAPAPAAAAPRPEPPATATNLEGAGPWTVKEVVEQPMLQGDQKIQTPPAQASAVAAPGQALTFDVAMVSGDKDIVEKLDAWKEWADRVVFNPVSPEEINQFHGKLTKALQEEGYVFAKVTFPTRIWAYGIFLAKVDCGPLGTITVTGNRYYSAKQVIGALQRQDGERFNYARIHGDLFDLNTQPDIAINTKLKPVMQDGRRVIHADLEVEDSLPIHGALEISNTGTKTSDNDYRIRATLQHLNLTKHYDVLTADWITSWDFDEVNAWAGGYYLPIGDLYSLSLFGGYSTSRMDDILPLLDIHGKGHFFGGQITRTMRDTPKYRLQLSGGWVFQHSETEHELANMSLQQRDIDMSMPQFTVGYAAKNFDKFGGRNFLSNTLIANFAGQFGSSESDEFNAGSTAYADGDFLINRVQIARLQRFFSGDDAPGKWTLFMKADGQFTSDTLPPDMRKVAGGANTVRGYEESEVAGDQVIAGTLELRTPLFHNFIPGLKKSDEFLDANPNAWQRHRLQFIAFTDFAYVDINNPRAGEFSTEHLLSAGLGFRLGLTKYSQARVDYGYPFEDASDDTPSSGRFHLSLQLQF